MDEYYKIIKGNKIHNTAIINWDKLKIELLQGAAKLFIKLSTYIFDDPGFTEFVIAPFLDPVE